MAPNKTYSGPVKPKLDSFVQLPFTSGAAEFNSLVGGKITVGYLPAEDITSPAKSPLEPGKNNPRLSNFKLDPWYAWGFNYFPYNFNSTGDGGQAGKIFRQLYFRQAFQLLVDQPLYLEKLNKNYGVPTYGPVPVLPKNSFSTKYESQNPYPYNPARRSRCSPRTAGRSTRRASRPAPTRRSAACRPARRSQFTLQYASGSAAQKQLMEAEQAAWQQAGIKITLTTASFNTVLGNAVPCSGKSCTWEIDSWGGGWVYAPDYYPSGELLFQTRSRLEQRQLLRQRERQADPRHELRRLDAGPVRELPRQGPPGRLAAEPGLRASPRSRTTCRA